MLRNFDSIMNNSDQEYLLQKAREKIEAGACRAAYKILAPLIVAKCPEALYLYSTFRLIRKETDEDFEKRSLGILTEAANLGSPEAQYRLGAYYDVGDVVDKDREKAAQLFKLAAEGGHSKAKAFHGLDLFYGLNGISQDKASGMGFLRQAVDEHVDGAEYELQRMYDTENQTN